MSQPGPWELLQAAHSMTERSWAPYSRFRVGAALLSASGALFRACNVENASYGLSLCAERAAVAAAVAAGERDLVALAVWGERSAQEPSGPCLPCGACRQVLAEFCSPEFLVWTVGGDGLPEAWTLKDLLPAAFTLSPPTKGAAEARRAGTGGDGV